MVKNPPANAGDIRDVGSIPESGRSPEGGHGNPLQHSCLENPMNRGAWWTTVHGVAKSQTRLKRLNMQHAKALAQWLVWGWAFGYGSFYRRRKQDPSRVLRVSSASDFGRIRTQVYQMKPLSCLSHQHVSCG